ITFELLLELFGDKVQKDKNGKINVKKSRFNTYDTFILEKGEYFNNEKITTTVGRFIYNKLIVERELVDVLGYINEPINSGTLSSIEDKISKALLNDKVAVDVVVNYLNRTQWLAMQFHSVISGSFTMGTLKPNKKVIERRNQLLNENREKLKKGDVITAAKIEKELLDIAQKELEGDHGLDLYKSGARGSFGNNYKNISVMKGPVYNPTTDEFEIVESNFMEGIRKEEIPIYGNAIIT
ncbi:hypothetical protein, partial [Brevibacillus sp. MCWH]|uniref:hypothetical protein n=1 Tax=Brevibacillus sp. MCWH TaxID=2508871 RepID=UPI0014926B31